MAKGVLTLDILLSKEIEYMIETGQYTEGEKLPSERKLAEHFGVQRGTVRSALQILQDKGAILCKEKSGHYVAQRRVSFNLEGHLSTKTVIEQMGRSTYAKMLTFEKIYVSEKMANKTGFPEDSQVYRIMRLRYAGGVPMGLERSHIRCDLVPNLTEEDIHNKSLYEVLRKKYQIYMVRSKGKVTAVYANGLESELLNLKVSRPIMRYEALAYDRHDRLVEYFDDIVLKDKVQFVSYDR